jgi:DNA-binding protein HU-beta
VDAAEAGFQHEGLLIYPDDGEALHQIWIDAIAEQTESSKAVTGRFPDSFIRHIQEPLAAGDDVKLTGFGTCEKASVSARFARNPSAGQAITIAATTRPKFTPRATFKERAKKSSYRPSTWFALTRSRRAGRARRTDGGTRAS